MSNIVIVAFYLLFKIFFESDLVFLGMEFHNLTPNRENEYNALYHRKLNQQNNPNSQLLPITVDRLCFEDACSSSEAQQCKLDRRPV